MGRTTCANCSQALDSEYAVKYCSQECFHEGHSFAGKNNPNYQGGKEVTKCELCGEGFQFYPSEKPGRYCSNCVENEKWQTPPGLSGPDHPRWSGGEIERECHVCGAKVRRRRSGFSGAVVLCGRECQATWFSESYTGEGHPNWKGGGSEHYGKGWRRAKLETLARDDHTCVICGINKDEIGRNPDVHHIVPVRSFIEAPGADKTDAHDPTNLVTLCVTCHRRADFGRPSKVELKRLVDGQS